MNSPRLRASKVPSKHAETSLNFVVIEGSCAFHCVCLQFLFLLFVFDKICVVWAFGPRTFSQKCFSFGFWVSEYGRLHGNCYRVLSDLTSARCRSACRFRDGPLLRVPHTDDIGIQQLVKRISVLLSMHRIGDTDGSVPSLLFPNTFAPTASDTISSKNSFRECPTTLSKILSYGLTLCIFASKV